MTAMDDSALLEKYARTDSESAFATLVERHIGLVYSAALRQVRDPHHAEDVTQAVFIVLARKAGKLSRHPGLSGWLLQTTRYAANAHIRSAIRRTQREQEAAMRSELNDSSHAWEQLEPLLDEAMASLGTADRTVVALRYFENRTAAQIGAALDLNEEAAKKRANRALEKLRKFFMRRGVTLSSAAIASAVAANSVQAAPSALANSVTAIAVAKGAAASGSTLTLIKGALKIMAWTKMKTSLVAGACILIIGATGLSLNTLRTHRHPFVREPWSNTGTTTPATAMESLLWALSNEKFDRAQEIMQWEISGDGFPQVRPTGDAHQNATIQEKMILQGTLAPQIKDVASFRVISTHSGERPDEMIVNVETTFKNGIRPTILEIVKLRRSGGQWHTVCEIIGHGNDFSIGALPFSGRPSTP
jgi:RNA polymerase sigma factor (sigma-70 family)